MLCCPAAVGQDAAPASALPTRADIDAAVARLRRDPNLPGEQKIKSLHWTTAKAPTAPAESPAWIVGLFDYLGQAANLLFWAAGAIGAGIAAIWIYRVLKARSPRPDGLVAGGTSRVGDLDITPGSLPQDIGAAALALLEAGRAREALSLLYRGALSRAVHRFGVAIGESFTEGEALKAMSAHLDPPRTQYFSDLVRQWQRTVYAGEEAAAQSVAGLCRDFAPALDGAAI